MKIVTEVKKIEDELFFKCDCGCRQQVLINIFNKDRIEINTRIDGRRRWTGVILNKIEIKKLQDFLSYI